MEHPKKKYLKRKKQSHSYPDEPKIQPQGPFGCFLRDKRAEIASTLAVETASKTKLGAVARKANQLWKALSDEERRPYQDQYQEMLKKFKADRESFWAARGIHGPYYKRTKVKSLAAVELIQQVTNLRNHFGDEIKCLTGQLREIREKMDMLFEVFNRAQAPAAPSGASVDTTTSTSTPRTQQKVRRKRKNKLEDTDGNEQAPEEHCPASAEADSSISDTRDSNVESHRVDVHLGSEHLPTPFLTGANSKRLLQRALRNMLPASMTSFMLEYASQGSPDWVPCASSSQTETMTAQLVATAAGNSQSFEEERWQHYQDVANSSNTMSRDGTVVLASGFSQRKASRLMCSVSDDIQDASIRCGLDDRKVILSDDIDHSLTPFLPDVDSILPPMFECNLASPSSV